MQDYFNPNKNFKRRKKSGLGRRLYFALLAFLAHASLQYFFFLSNVM